jgi:hypothetical protein
MPVIINLSVGNGAPTSLFASIVLPGHGHITRDSDGNGYIDVFGLPEHVGEYTIDLFKSDLIDITGTGYCPVCKGSCPCCPTLHVP